MYYGIAFKKHHATHSNKNSLPIFFITFKEDLESLTALWFFNNIKKCNVDIILEHDRPFSKVLILNANAQFASQSSRRRCNNASAA